METQATTGYRLSSQQRRIWKLLQEGPALSAQCAVLLEGALDKDRLGEAVAQVIARHEILRTTFYRPPGIKVPFQVIADPEPAAWRELDLSGLDDGQQEAGVEELLRRESGDPMVLDQGPLLRLALVTLSADRRLLVVTAPSLCADSETLGNFVRELGHFYAGYGKEDVASDPLQYADFTQWQREALEADDEDARDGKAYWSQDRFASTAFVKLPLEARPDDPNPVPTGIGLEATAICLPADLARQIERAASDCGASAHAFLLTGWQTLLGRVSGQSDVLVAAVCDGRRDEDLRQAMGPFARAVPVIERIEPGRPFTEVLLGVEQSLREARLWQDYCTWEDTLATAGDERDAPVGFEFVEWPARREADGAWISVERQSSVLHRFKLHLACARHDNGLSFVVGHDPARLDGNEVRRLADGLVALLRDAARSPEQPVDRLNLLSDAERRRLLVDFGAGPAEPPPATCVHLEFEEQARRTPGRTAVVFEDRELSYRELNARANRLARYLRHNGVKPGVCVGLCVDRSLEMLVGVLGILKAGGAYVALNPEYPKQRLAQQLEEIESPMLLTQERHREQFAEFAGQTVCLDRDDAFWADQPDGDLPCLAGPEDPVYVMYTSGSTGRPKGVVVEHRSLANYTRHICRRLGLDGSDELHFATVSTITADLGNTCIYPSLVSGGCLHVLSYEVATDGARFAEYVAQHPIDVLKIVPSHFRALLASRPEGVNVLPRRCLIFGGEALSHALVEQIAPLAGGCEVINHYGPTETTVGSLMAAVDMAGRSPWRPSTVPIGRPISNTTILVLDEHRRPVPVGVPGELYIGGAGVARGYLKQPERTAERFLADPVAGGPDGRFYRTGDLVRYLPDGQVEFLGRTDHQVKIRGYRVELEDIEVALGRHPAVRQAVVLAREDEPDHKRLVAYIVAEGPSRPAAADLQRHLQDELPPYMIPSALVLLEQLPLTRNGKIDRAALPAPDKASSAAAKPYVAPRNAAETLLSGIWAQVVGRPQVGIHDNFFSDLGGDSILSIQIIARANQAGMRLVPKQIFEHQTIAELAAVAGTAATVQAEQGPVTGPMLLTPIQHWFFEQQFADAHHWNQAVFFELRQPVAPEHLAAAVDSLMAHHDALRIRFRRAESEWQPTCGDVDGQTPFCWLDLSQVSPARQKDVVEAAAARVQASLHLSEGPLVRVAYFHLGPEQPGRLLIVIHHLVVDGVSWRVLLEDLQTAAGQAIGGRKIQLPAKTTSLKSWAERLAEHAGSETLREELAYWSRAPRTSPRGLSRDFPTGRNTVASMQTVSIALDPEETRGVLEEIPEVYQTQINDVLLAAYLLAYSRWSGTRSALVDLEGHGREEIVDDVDLWRTVGWFTTHFPVLLELADASTPGDALKAVKEQLRAVPNRGIGYGVLRYLSPDEPTRRRLGALPHPEVSFNYLGQFDQVLSETSLLAPAQERMGPLQSPRGHRSHLVQVIGSVSGGQLRLSVAYSENLFRRETIEELARAMAEQLRAILAHCRSPEAGGHTPSDFALAGLDQEQFGKIAGLIDAMDDCDPEETLNA